jgi:hypothetical protein
LRCFDEPSFFSAKPACKKPERLSKYNTKYDKYLKANTKTRKTYTNETITRLKLFASAKVVVDQTKAGGLAAAKSYLSTSIIE